jgi:5-hydroxyisourate hydrolase
MTGGVSVHVVDVSRGVVAAWMRVELYALQPDRRLIASGIVSAKGLVEEPAFGQRFAPGSYESHYHLPLKVTPWGYSCFRGGA